MPDPDTRLDYGGLSRFWNKVKTYITGVLPGNATQSAAGLMSAADKTKLDNFSVVDGKLCITYTREVS